MLENTEKLATQGTQNKEKQNITTVTHAGHHHSQIWYLLFFEKVLSNHTFLEPEEQ
jgi:hypothetical protein